MSKRKKNYPDPMNVVHSHGADAIRYVHLDSIFLHISNLYNNVHYVICS